MLIHFQGFFKNLRWQNQDRLDVSKIQERFEIVLNRLYEKWCFEVLHSHGGLR